MFKELRNYIKRKCDGSCSWGYNWSRFGKIVTSLVDDIIMPVIGIILGKIDFSNLKLVITPASGSTPEAAVNTDYLFKCS